MLQTQFFDRDDDPPRTLLFHRDSKHHVERPYEFIVTRSITEPYEFIGILTSCTKGILTGRGPPNLVTVRCFMRGEHARHLYETIGFGEGRPQRDIE